MCVRAQSCLSLCHPMDCNPPDSSVHGIFQARILEWFAISYSRESSQPKEQTRISWVSCIGGQILDYCHLGSNSVYRCLLWVGIIQFILVMSQQAVLDVPVRKPRSYQNELKKALAMLPGVFLDFFQWKQEFVRSDKSFLNPCPRNQV